jgi:DNA-binding IclR family transcriptional regulator
MTEETTEAEPPAPPDDFVRSVARGLRILEVVAAEPGLPVKAIARRCSLNVSTTYHLVRTLAYEGYLERLPEGTYVAGAELSRRFYDVLGALGRPPQAGQVLRHLSERTGLSAYMGRLSDGQVVVVDYAEGSGSPYLEEFERGLSVSVHATALGKALLLVMPSRERHRFLREVGMRPFTARTARDPDSLGTQLAMLTEDAVVEEHGEFRDGVACAARLVPRSTAEETAWALVLSVRGDAVPEAAQWELTLAASDIAESSA